MTNLLVITTLYPNEIQFRHGIFVEARVRQLIERFEYKASVIAPVPWFPISSRYFPVYSKYAQVPAEEERFGIRVYHPRYLVIPKIGMLLTPFFLALGVIFGLRKLKKAGFSADLVDTHYYYPDAVAVTLVSKVLKKPFVATAHGSDINVLTKFGLPRLMMKWAATKAAATIAVSNALRKRILNLGFDEAKVHLLRNGVDLKRFVPLPRQKCKEKFRVGECTLLSVGNLIELKGHDLVIRAVPHFPQCDLLIVGDGEKRDELEALVASLGLENKVRFLPSVPQSELVEIYNAADILVLASSREGLPLVVLEAMACGTPVVATSVGGIPEVVDAPAAGVLTDTRDVEGIVRAIEKLLANYPQNKKTRRHAETFSLEGSAIELDRLLEVVKAENS